MIAVSFIDDITVILPPEFSLDMAAIEKVTEWLQERLGVGGISLNRRKPQVLLADRVSDGRAAHSDVWHRVHGGLTGDEGGGSIRWNRIFQAEFLAGGN